MRTVVFALALPLLCALLFSGCIVEDRGTTPASNAPAAQPAPPPAPTVPPPAPTQKTPPQEGGGKKGKKGT